MKIIIIETKKNYAFAQELSQHYEYSETILINKNTDLSAFDIARSINQAAPNDDEILLILNIHLSNGQFRDYCFGVEVLKEIRINERYEEKSKIQNCHVVLLSVFPLDHFLKMDANFLIAASPGTTFIKQPYDLTKLKVKNLVTKKVLNLRTLVPYLKTGDTILDERHSHANWWAANKLLNNYTLLYPNTIKDERIKSFVQHKTQQLRDTIFIHQQISKPLKQSKINKIRKKINALKEKLQVRPNEFVKIGIIDDQATQIHARTNIGWKYIYEQLLFDGKHHLELIDGTADDERILAQIDESYHCIFLDLLLDKADSSKKVEQTKGAKLLKQIKQKFPMLPVILTTASNKASKQKALKRFGCDAFYTKEGIDERLSQQQSLAKYKELLVITSTVTGRQYSFLKKCMSLVRQIEHQTCWWENCEWQIGDSLNFFNVTTDKQEIVEKLNQALILLRTYLQNKLLGEGLKTPLDESFWLSGIIIKLATVIEMFHDESYGQITSRSMREHHDYFGSELYILRHKAAHYKENDPINFDYLAHFLKCFLAYLLHGPKAVFHRSNYRRTRHKPFPSLCDMIKKEVHYKKIYYDFFDLN